ncbi:cysteine hydrolase family protein [Pseudanabaena sp. 'Roaring Creek']|uniref:cysteine hydrolase family protein n=1 Tax=Pseudanabaena sp. 'Roaring Creek' TaxID=1681830 RepID=UPI0006D81E06|nr:cysteine hydrolase [Pseudanabaena sp. 'Roaring Creek']
MHKYTHPKQSSSALISIDVQNDFTLIGSPAKIRGTHEKVPQMLQLLNAFRAAERPIIHVIRLYLPDGSNVDACRKEMIEDGIKIAAPDTIGAELVNELKPNKLIRLASDELLRGEFQLLGKQEWAMYKPRWDAFYQTALESYLHTLGVDTVIFCGCNFPNCPRASIYGASMRDFRIVLVTDAVSGIYEKGLEELRNINVSLMTTVECIDWIGGSHSDQIAV